MKVEIWMVTAEYQGDRVVTGYPSEAAAVAHVTAEIERLMKEGDIDPAGVPHFHSNDGDMHLAWEAVRMDSLDGLWLDSLTIDVPLPTGDADLRAASGALGEALLADIWKRPSELDGSTRTVLESAFIAIPHAIDFMKAQGWHRAEVERVKLHSDRLDIAIDALLSALDACTTQIEQMQGMFVDSDGDIARSLEAAKDARDITERARRH